MIPLLLVRVGESRYAFYGREIDEVILCPHLETYDGQSELLDGLFRLGESWIAVVPLARLLDIPGSEPGHYDPLILLKGETVMAIRVNKVEGVQRVSIDELKPLLSVEDGHAKAARLDLGSEPVYLLTSADLLLATERKVLHRSTELYTQRQARAKEELEHLKGETLS